MNVLRIFLLCTVLMAVLLAHVSTTSLKFFGDHDVDNMDFKEKSNKVRSASSQIKRTELASKLILLGKLLLKQTGREESLAMRSSQAPNRRERVERLLEKLFLNQRHVDRQINEDKDTALRNLENSIFQNDATFNKRAAGRCRCRPPHMQCDTDNCTNN